MSTLTTKYLGLQLATPVVVSSLPMNASLESLLAMEAAGAGAVVLPSLFQEQLDLEDMGFQFDDEIGQAIWPEHLKRLPNLQSYNTGIAGYLNLLWTASRTVNMPLIASLNATSPSGIERYARLLASAGASAIELNIYDVPVDTVVPGEMLEETYLRLVGAVCNSVSIPVSVKLHPYFSSLPNIVRRIVDAGASGVTLFNRFYQPDINLNTETVVSHLTLSDSSILRKRLRWVALMQRQVRTDYGITGGVHSGDDVLKGLMAGATVVMTASAVIRNGPQAIEAMLEDVEAWLEAHGYDSTDAIRGKLAAKRRETTSAFERANYINELFSYQATA